MGLKKLWIIPLALVIGLAFYLIRSKESGSPSLSREPIVAAVEARPIIPMTYRIGVDISGTESQNLADILKPLRPSWIRSETTSPQFFALCAELQANPWITVPASL